MHVPSIFDADAELRPPTFIFDNLQAHRLPTALEIHSKTYTYEHHRLAVHAVAVRHCYLVAFVLQQLLPHSPPPPPTKAGSAQEAGSLVVSSPAHRLDKNSLMSGHCSDRNCTLEHAHKELKQRSLAVPSVLWHASIAMHVFNAWQSCTRRTHVWAKEFTVCSLEEALSMGWQRGCWLPMPEEGGGGDCPWLCHAHCCLASLCRSMGSTGAKGKCFIAPSSSTMDTIVIYCLLISCQLDQRESEIAAASAENQDVLWWA